MTDGHDLCGGWNDMGTGSGSGATDLGTEQSIYQSRLPQTSLTYRPDRERERGREGGRREGGGREGGREGERGREEGGKEGGREGGREEGERECVCVCVQMNSIPKLLYHIKHVQRPPPHSVTHFMRKKRVNGLTYDHEVQFEASLEGFLADLFLDGVKPDIAIEFGSQVTPACGLRHNVSHQLQELSKGHRAISCREREGGGGKEEWRNGGIVRTEREVM